MTTNKKFIVWDWNGTLQDDLSVSMAALNHTLKSLGRPIVDADRYRACFDVPIVRMYRNLGLNEDEIAHCLKPEHNSYFDIYDRLIEAVDFRHGARDVLDFASAFDVLHVILSNHLVDVIHKDLTRLKKREAFKDILAWPDRKSQFAHPKGDFLCAYMERNGLMAQNGIIVGDTPEEVKAARQHGLVSVALSGGYNSLALLEEAKPDYIISALPELKPILQERGFAA